MRPTLYATGEILAVHSITSEPQPYELWPTARGTPSTSEVPIYGVYEGRPGHGFTHSCGISTRHEQQTRFIRIFDPAHSKELRGSFEIPSEYQKGYAARIRQLRDYGTMVDRVDANFEMLQRHLRERRSIEEDDAWSALMGEASERGDVTAVVDNGLLNSRDTERDDNPNVSRKWNQLLNELKERCAEDTSAAELEQLAQELFLIRYQERQFLEETSNLIRMQALQSACCVPFLGTCRVQVVLSDEEGDWLDVPAIITEFVDGMQGAESGHAISPAAATLLSARDGCIEHFAREAQYLIHTLSYACLGLQDYGFSNLVLRGPFPNEFVLTLVDSGAVIDTIQLCASNMFCHDWDDGIIRMVKRVAKVDGQNFESTSRFWPPNYELHGDIAVWQYIVEEVFHFDEVREAIELVPLTVEFAKRVTTILRLGRALSTRMPWPIPHLIVIEWTLMGESRDIQASVEDMITKVEEVRTHLASVPQTIQAIRGDVWNPTSTHQSRKVENSGEALLPAKERTGEKRHD